MFSTNIKRSVATLGVVAGLLAAAVPASAATLDNAEILDAVKAPRANSSEVAVESVTQARVNAPFTLNVASSEVFELNVVGGTQVGSEGVKAPKPSDADRSVSITNGNADDQMALSPQAPTSDGLISVTADAGSGDDNLRGEAIDIIP